MLMMRKYNPRFATESEIEAQRYAKRREWLDFGWVFRCFFPLAFRSGLPVPGYCLLGDGQGSGDLGLR